MEVNDQKVTVAGGRLKFFSILKIIARKKRNLSQAIKAAYKPFGS
jgi:hypothetical protein